MSAQLHGILLEVKALAVLAGWEPVGSRVEVLTCAIQGTGSISEHALTQLRTWSRRWTALGEPRRAFYVRHLADEVPTARVVLWAILNARRAQAWQIRRLELLWQQDTGCLPLRLDLAPIIE